MPESPGPHITDQRSADRLRLNGVSIDHGFIRADFAVAAEHAATKARHLRKTNHFTLMGRWVPHPELEGCAVCGAMVDPAETAMHATLSVNDGPAVPICEPCAVRMAVACDA